MSDTATKRGGKRIGAGRPVKDPGGSRRAKEVFFITPEEKLDLRERLEFIRVAWAKKARRRTATVAPIKDMSDLEIRVADLSVTALEEIVKSVVCALYENEAGDLDPNNEWKDVGNKIFEVLKGRGLVML